MVARTCEQLKGASVQNFDLPDIPIWRVAGMVTFDEKLPHIANLTSCHAEKIDPKGEQRELSSRR